MKAKLHPVVQGQLHLAMVGQGQPGNLGAPLDLPPVATEVAKPVVWPSTAGGILGGLGPQPLCETYRRGCQLDMTRSNC